MRKNTARKWVHLLLDLLPVLIIPIFAIYLINHNPQGLQVETGGWEVQEKYQTNEVNNVNDLQNNNIYFIEYLYFTPNEVSDYDFSLNVLSVNSASNISRYEYIDEVYIYDYNANNENNLYLSVGVNEIGISFTNDNSYITTYYNYNLTFNNVVFQLDENEDNLPSIRKYFTQLNEDYFILPSATDFNVFEYTYNEGMIYDNTDIGSQLIYSMYIPVRDYFNMTNLFNFGDIYNWINTSMFGGNAPLPIFIVYNVIVYEFLIDLIFLIYSIFMFIIDFSSELLARCFSFSNKGGTR